MEWIYNYIKNVGYFMVFSCVIRLLVPKDNFRGYVDMFLGIIFIIVMLDPIYGILNGGDTDLEDYILKMGYELGQELYPQTKTEAGREIVEDEYSRLAEEQISKLCKGFVEFPETEVMIGTAFEIEEIHIRGNITGDKSRLRDILHDSFGTSEDKIYIDGGT